ncbi:hypothetical protein F5882DRAFT_504350 [Hyaloscypha sp. PMI_1271]|nr:hypothetical protein F5882DRAFT_504350 [Hyaloscypha sp. PMI_1271]
MSVDSQYVYSMIWKQNDYYPGVEYVASRGQNYQRDHTQAYEIHQDPCHKNMESKSSVHKMISNPELSLPPRSLRSISRSIPKALRKLSRPLICFIGLILDTWMVKIILLPSSNSSTEAMALKALMFIPRTPELERAPRTPYSQLTEEQRRKPDAIAKSLLEKADLPIFTLRESREGNGVIKKEDVGRKDVILFKPGRNTGVSNKVIDLADDDQPMKRRRMPQGELVDLTIEEEDLIDLHG